MANEKLKRMLELSKKVDDQVSSGNTSRPIQRKANLEEQLKKIQNKPVEEKEHKLWKGWPKNEKKK